MRILFLYAAGIIILTEMLYFLLLFPSRAKSHDVQLPECFSLLGGIGTVSHHYNAAPKHVALNILTLNTSVVPKS